MSVCLFLHRLHLQLSIFLFLCLSLSICYLSLSLSTDFLRLPAALSLLMALDISWTHRPQLYLMTFVSNTTPSILPPCASQLKRPSAAQLSFPHVWQLVVWLPSGPGLHASSLKWSVIKHGPLRSKGCSRSILLPQRGLWAGK